MKEISSMLFRFECTMQIIVNSHLQDGCSFLSMPIWSRELFFLHQSMIKSLVHTVTMLNGPYSSSTSPCRAICRFEFSYFSLSNGCQLQFQSPVCIPIYPTFAEKGWIYIFPKVFGPERVHRNSNSTIYCSENQSITPPLHPTGDKLFQKETGEQYCLRPIWLYSTNSLSEKPGEMKV